METKSFINENYEALESISLQIAVIRDSTSDNLDKEEAFFTKWRYIYLFDSIRRLSKTMFRLTKHPIFANIESFAQEMLREQKKGKKLMSICNKWLGIVGDAQDEISKLVNNKL